MQRRNFLKNSGLLAGGFLTAKWPLTAGPFNKQDFTNGHFPADKKLDKAWVASLYERGTPTTYTKTNNELQFIGMPVGGICCGGVYVGGDGRLWLWDIFNQNQFGAVPKTLPVKLDGFNIKEIRNSEGTLYLQPATYTSPLQQGFALIIEYAGNTIVKRLHQDDWDEVTFEAGYPVATIRYTANNLPLQVSLDAFSPFIPGNADDSGLPATVQAVTLKNVSTEIMSVTVVGWLENKMLLYSENDKNGFTRHNTAVKTGALTGVAIGCTTTDKGLEKAADYGSMFLGSLNNKAICIPDMANSGNKNIAALKNAVKAIGNAPVGAIVTTHRLKPTQTANADFVIAWHTPNVSFYSKGNPQGMTVEGANQHYYTNRFNNAQSAAGYVSANYTGLKQQTMLWKATWYNSTLPYWFLERTLLNISTLATTVSHRFASGRFYAWEGVGCCHGNCTHVYQYAQAMGRIFPSLERDTRQRVDLGIGYDEATGMIHIRGEKTGPSIDGQAGTLLRIYREHQMSSDNSFLHTNWPKIKKAVAFLMLQDKNGDGMEDTPMENTLDALWHGEIAWIVGLCLTGVRAGQAMAEEMGDTAFADTCRQYVEKGSKNMEDKLFNGEYFIHQADPTVGKKEIGSFNTCHIDQVYGQSWAWQVGLGRVIGKEKTMSALRALWKYNYMPDVAMYIKDHPGGRFYALAGEGGMLMNTNPRNDENPYGDAKAWQLGYFSECMSGFEHQVAAHMMAEGMVEESLVLTRSIHDRYHAVKRNPFNEIECSDHYGRAMASFGSFINACGFTYHGPKGQIGFAPKLAPESFTAPFTVAEGWGTYSQKRGAGGLSAEVKLAYGNLRLKQFTAELAEGAKASKAEVHFNANTIACGVTQTGNTCIVKMDSFILVGAGQIFSIKIS